MMDATAASASEVVRAAIVARDGFDLNRLWAETDALDDKISGEMQNRTLRGDRQYLHRADTSAAEDRHDPSADGGNH